MSNNKYMRGCKYAVNSASRLNIIPAWQKLKKERTERACIDNKEHDKITLALTQSTAPDAETNTDNIKSTTHDKTRSMTTSIRLECGDELVLDEVIIEETVTLDQIVVYDVIAEFGCVFHLKRRMRALSEQTIDFGDIGR